MKIKKILIIIVFILTCCSCAEYQEFYVDTSLGEIRILHIPKDDQKNDYGTLTISDYNILDKIFFLEATKIMNKINLNSLYIYDTNDDAYYGIELERKSEKEFLLKFNDNNDERITLVTCKIIDRKFDCKKTDDFEEGSPFNLENFNLKNR